MFACVNGRRSAGHRRLGVLALTALALLAGCGSAGQPSASPSTSASGPAEPSQVTLRDNGCSGPSAAIPAAASISVENETSTGPANFELVRLTGTFEEADEFLTEARAGDKPAPGELPFIAEEADRAFVEPGDTGELAAELAGGTYAVVCVALDEREDIIMAFVVGPYTGSE